MLLQIYPQAMAALFVSMILSEQINIYFWSILLALEQKLMFSSLWNMYLDDRDIQLLLWHEYNVFNMTKEVGLVANKRRHRPKFPWTLNKAFFWVPKTFSFVSFSVPLHRKCVKNPKIWMFHLYVIQELFFLVFVESQWGQILTVELLNCITIRVAIAS